MIRVGDEYVGLEYQVQHQQADHQALQRKGAKNDWLLGKLDIQKCTPRCGRPIGRLVGLHSVLVYLWQWR